MAMFNSGNGPDTKPKTQIPPGPRTPTKEPGLSIIAVGTHVTGQVDTNGVIKVEGAVTGSVRAEGQVLVAKGGMVDGDILTREAIIGGEVRGAIYADDRVEVQASSAIHGDITTQRIVVQEGGDVNGHIKMGNPEALKRTSEVGEHQAALERPHAPRLQQSREPQVAVQPQAI
jgi:cytoskeletal protein CcmA (bactofilin family)